STLSRNHEGKQYEEIVRIGATSSEDGTDRAWWVFTATGWDPLLTLDELILTAESEIKLSFVYDLDSDQLTGSVEFLNGCSDSNLDSDGDGLTDFFEIATGWNVETPRGTLAVRS